MRSSLAPVLLTLALIPGCVTEATTDSQDTNFTGPLVNAELPPPPAPTLTLQNKLLVPSLTQQIRVTGADPGDIVYLLRSTGTGARDQCLPNPPICTNLRGPLSKIKAIGSAVADASGTATIAFFVPIPPVANTRYQAIADPFGAYELSGVLTPRYGAPAADADADGLSNGAEASAGTDPELADTDGGGISDGDEVLVYATDPLDPADDPIDGDGDGYPRGLTDCDDADPAINPGQPELCNGFDDNCDGVVDDDLAWWHPAWPYRLPITVSAPAGWNAASPPVSVDLDFAGALAALGDASGLDVNSIRVVRQSCGLGQPEMPSEWMDDVSGVFSKADIADALGDERGAIVFQADQDGDYASLETFSAGSTAVFAVYFGSLTQGPGAAAPTYPSSLVATNDGTVAELYNTRSKAVFRTTDASGTPHGGLTEYFGVQGGPNVGKMTGTGTGNGIFFNTPGGGPSGGWLSARGDGAAIMTIEHIGPVFGAVRSEGTRVFGGTTVTGGFDYSYTFTMFDGRPEMYIKPHFVINTDDSNLGPQGAAWTAAVRPFTVDNLTFSSAYTSEGSREVPGFNWVRGTYDVLGAPFGLAAGFRQSVLQRGSPTYQADGRWVGLVGQDYELAPTVTEKRLDTGDVVVDNPIIVAYPHYGPFGSVSVDFYSVVEGVGTSLGAPEAW